MKTLGGAKRGRRACRLSHRPDRRLSGPGRTRMRDYKKALVANRDQPARDRSLWQLSGAGGPRRRTRATLYEKFVGEAGVAPIAQRRPGAACRQQQARALHPQRRGRRGGRPVRHRRVAERSIQRRSLDPLSAHGALSAGPIWRWPIFCWPTGSRRWAKYEEAVAIYREIDKSSPYYRMAATQAAVDESRLDHKASAIADLQSAGGGLSQRQRELDRAGRRLSRPGQ